MRLIGHITVVSLLFSTPLFAQFPSGEGDSMDELKKYVENLGGYLGYNITKAAATISASLIDETTLATLQKSTIDLFLSTIPISSVIAPDPNHLNDLVNTLFKAQSPAASALETSHLIDQKMLMSSSSGGGDMVEYSTDPISQSLVNILATPSRSICMAATLNGSNNSNAKDPTIVNCSSSPLVKYQEAIAYEVMGKMPNPNNAYSVNTDLINQLNSNTLIAPMIYSINNGNPNSNTSGKGLQATNQAQEAENFIRYASSAVSPPRQIDETTFTALLSQATKTASTPQEIQASLDALSALSGYFVGMRSYTAQVSVGIGNLYHLLAKRMPQTVGGATGTTTSQAYNEYVMATKRLYNPAPAATGGPQTPNTQWVDNINTASPATVQKEIAILLSEINYQLYLSRQQEERLLLTNTAMLFQLAHLVIPPPPTPQGPGAAPSIPH